MVAASSWSKLLPDWIRKVMASLSPGRALGGAVVGPWKRQIQPEQAKIPAALTYLPERLV